MKFYGIYPAIVIQNNDPEKAGRVKVFVPGITNVQYENWNAEALNREFSFVDGQLTPILNSLREALPWAVNASPAFGGSSNMLSMGNSSTTISRPSGTFSIPNVGSHVFIFFIAGDINNPVFFAANHSVEEWTSTLGANYPAEYENAGSGSYVNKHVINTNKHYIEFIDSDGVEEIKIFSAKNKTCTVTLDDTLIIGGNWAMTIAGNATVSVGGNAEISVGGSIDMTAGGEINITAGGPCSLKGSVINLN